MLVFFFSKAKFDLGKAKVWARFTVTTLLEATDSWAIIIDRGHVDTVVFLDLKKAFDTVNHDILLAKSQHHGHEWFIVFIGY